MLHKDVGYQLGKTVLQKNKKESLFDRQMDFY